MDSGASELFKSQALKRVEDNADQRYKWEVVSDHTPDVVLEEYDHFPGLIGFDFGRLGEFLNVESPDYDHPFASLFEKLWPGSVERQRRKMNEAVKKDNLMTKKNIKQFTLEEWWHGIGIIVLAGPAEMGGEKLWEGRKNMEQNLPSVIRRDPVTVMKKYRFGEFKRYFHFAFEGNDPNDPWNPIIGLVNGFNSNRQLNVAASHKKCMDELMSAFQPRSTPLGGLPNFSYVKRKPRPYGIEMKVLACTVTSKLTIEYAYVNVLL